MKVHVGDYQFQCSNEVEKWRAETLFTKEEGTVKWLLNECEPSDVLYDIGANIGLYTVVAAKAGTFVYAFEPHAANLVSLLENITLNVISEYVQVISGALGERTGFFPFYYASQKAGTSGSQLGHTVSESGQSFTPRASELKATFTVDYLLDERGIKPATLVKLDVDGNELAILKGMSDFLRLKPPRSLQVEVHPIDRAAIQEFMETRGFRLTERHYTTIGKKHLAQGVPPDEITHNAVYYRA